MYNAIIPSSARYLCGIPNLVKKRKDVKRPTSSPNWHQGYHTEIPQVSLMGSASCLFCLWDRDGSTSPSPSLTFCCPVVLCPKSPEDLSWIPVSSFTVCSKWNLCLPLPHLLLLPSPLLLFMVPLWLKIIAMPSVLSFPLLPRYDGLLLFLPCLINQLTSSVPSLCLCPS